MDLKRAETSEVRAKRLNQTQRVWRGLPKFGFIFESADTPAPTPTRSTPTPQKSAQPVRMS
ncbi:MAG: hypothetical protein AAB342_02325, partial [Chloroflexota bacterium]